MSCYCYCSVALPHDAAQGYVGPSLVVGGIVGVDIPTLDHYWTRRNRECQLFLSLDLLNSNEILQKSSVSLF